MKPFILLLVLFLVIGIKQKHRLVSRLVLHRTYGMLVMQKLNNTTTDSCSLDFCNQMKEHFALTQHRLIKLCEDKDLKLGQADFDALESLIAHNLEQGHIKQNEALQDELKVHLLISIIMYLKLIEKDQHEDISAFASFAVSDLMDIHSDMERRAMFSR